ncbi:hypothetical protein GCM10009836_24000 [Pseudonocardia ailaonensis]|uniref:Type I-U CRISPR-associated protein Cas7 n=1 Tax=Pseudonocardia ailaonensis TaxID=367279 RepID=A0ABN2MZN4_9PSEU
MATTEDWYDALLNAVGLDGNRAILRITTTYQAAGGDGSKVFPPTFPAPGGRTGESIYLLEDRVVDGKPRNAVVLDQVPSQANRAEEALLRAYREGRVQVPLLQIDHSGAAPLVLTSLEFPHRYADAYLRDSLLDGEAFDRTSLGKELLSASLADATALYSRDPGSLIYGAWNSHRKGRQQKFPRVYSSEIVGWGPATGARHAGRMDPANLSGARKGPADSWEFTISAKKAKDEKLSEIGHGNVAPNAQHGGVTITSAQRFATLSLAGLDRIRFGSQPRSAAVAARAALAAYALVADRLAFGGPSLWLRSGCELVVADERIDWVLRGGATESLTLTTSDAVDLYGLAVAEAEKQGLPFALEPVALTPSKALAQAIDYALTKADGDEA